ncbi:MAG: nucleotidyl transferase AbiEii/AbiGii toxin family protein [Planctomycetes bacterium]|nr:nucleotidyl transferase AbiEii/AbiGii toxin family protein [Planctomycetota bacterium]
MSPAKKRANLAASVRARLFDLSRHRGVEFQLVLSEYAIERLLFRLGESAYSERFVLKGATLFKLWTGEHHRATWDLDLLGRGRSTAAEVVAVIQDVCSIRVQDGIEFDTVSVAAEEIRTADEYTGVRVRFQARLDDALIPVRVDVGFGDAVEPAPSRQVYPTLLDHPPPRILVYPREAVVAEKVEAMISLAVTNSRMKDFYDVHVLASTFAFDGATLARAVRATFLRRATPFPDGEPLVLSPGFLSAPERDTQWRAFLKRGRLVVRLDAARLADGLREFLVPVLRAAAAGEPFAATWPPGGPWKGSA